MKWNRWQLIDTVNHMVAVWLCNVTSVLQRWTDEVSECGLFFQNFCDLTCHHPCLEGVSSVAKRKEERNGPITLIQGFLFALSRNPLCLRSCSESDVM